MSMRDTMRDSAIKGLSENLKDDIKHISIKARMEDDLFIENNIDKFPNATCYMCYSKDCDEIKYGNNKYSSTKVLYLCKKCQKIMANFLMENSVDERVD